MKNHYVDIFYVVEKQQKNNLLPAVRACDG